MEKIQSRDNIQTTAPPSTGIGYSTMESASQPSVAPTQALSLE